jgi:hypothetical protein
MTSQEKSTLQAFAFVRIAGCTALVWRLANQQRRQKRAGVWRGIILGPCDSGFRLYRFVAHPAPRRFALRGCRSSKRPTAGSYGKA